MVSGNSGMVHCSFVGEIHSLKVRGFQPRRVKLATTLLSKPVTRFQTTFPPDKTVCLALLQAMRKSCGFSAKCLGTNFIHRQTSSLRMHCQGSRLRPKQTKMQVLRHLWELMDTPVVEAAILRNLRHAVGASPTNWWPQVACG